MVPRESVCRVKPCKDLNYNTEMSWSCYAAIGDPAGVFTIGRSVRTAASPQTSRPQLLNIVFHPGLEL